MIKIENTQVFGWEAAIRGARNPMNSWEKSDSIWVDTSHDFDENDIPITIMKHYEIGPNDHKLLMNLCKGGTEEAKWRRMVHVQMDVTAPLYWWKEFETYKVGTVSNSCSTMHKIHAKEFTRDDFSCEHLFASDSIIGMWYSQVAEEELSGIDILDIVIEFLNRYREMFIKTKYKQCWWQMIQFLPSSYNQKRTIDLNYEVLASQYRQRKDHKLDEWHQYCDWIKTLPYSEFITLDKNSSDKY